MKHFLLVSLFPAMVTAQSMQLTEQLGKTVLYGDIALSPDGTRIAWVQSTAASARPKEIHLCLASTNAAALLLKLPGQNERRIDADPVWSPDSKTLAFFSTAAADRAGLTSEQRQLWKADAEG